MDGVCIGGSGSSGGCLFDGQLPECEGGAGEPGEVVAERVICVGEILLLGIKSKVESRGLMVSKLWFICQLHFLQKTCSALG